MTEQHSLFDDEGARRARDEAIARADEHAQPDWKQVALHVVESFAAKGQPFTADDVWAELEGQVPTTHEPAALGPVFLRAAKAHIIRKTGRLVPSRIPRRHRDLTEWTGA